jgi:hypothetical protein
MTSEVPFAHDSAAQPYWSKSRTGTGSQLPGSGQVARKLSEKAGASSSRLVHRGSRASSVGFAPQVLDRCDDFVL